MIISTKIKLITGIVIFSASFFFNFVERNAVVNANLLSGYNPPPPEKIDIRRTTGSGSRSNCSSILSEEELILLVPEEEVVYYTASSSPSFYVKTNVSVATSLEFNLVIPKPDTPEPLWESSLTLKRAGIHQIKLPENVKLETGEIYLWQIAIPCQGNSGQIAQVVNAAIKKIPLSQKTKNQIKNVDTPLEQAQIYAHQGIWYDALFLAKQESDSANSSSYFQQLLKDANLNLP